MNNLYSNLGSFYAFLLLFNISVFAQQKFKIFSSNPPNYNNVVIESQNSNTNRTTVTSLYLNVSCFPTNLRSVAHPLSPYNDVIANIELEDSKGNSSFISFKFPAALSGDEKNADFNLLGIKMDPFKSTSILSGPTGTKIVTSSNRLLRIDMPNMATMEIKNDGSVNINRKISFIKSIQFEQIPVSDATARQGVIDKFGKYLGIVQYSGPLTAQISHSISTDLKTFTVNASFPGAAGFCGGFYSPLMLVFDEKDIPEFKTKSLFKLNPLSSQVYWPEPKAKIYFLAIDTNKNKKIDNGEELFGDQKNFSNGFEALKELDSNKDLVIDEKDKEFKNLVLWKDLNGNSVSEKREIKKISEFNIISIDLKYLNYFKAFGKRAVIKQKSFFKFKDKNGKIKESSLYDVYFNSAGNEDKEKK